MSGLSDTSAFETFDRMSQKIDQLEAEAEAGAEIAGEMSGDTLESRFKQLEASGGGDGTADHALAELKAKMGLGPAPEIKGHIPERTASSLSEEDLRELEELDLGETEPEEKQKAPAE